MHPLDQLSAAEIKVARDAVVKHSPVEGLRFIAITLAEPANDLLRAFESDPAVVPPRRAEVLTLNPHTGIAAEVVVDLGEQPAAVVREKVFARGQQPMYTPDDCFLAEEIVKADTGVQALLESRYGITDMGRVACDPWSVNLADAVDGEMAEWRADCDGVPGRMIQTFLYLRALGDGLEDNHYAHPIDLLPVVDLNKRCVVRVDGADRPAPENGIPKAHVNYHRDLLSQNSYLQQSWRADTLRKLDVLQAEGPSFSVEGNLVRWQGWTVRVGFNYREGLVLHDCRFQGRSVLRRGSLVEMAVPYADPHPPFQRKCAFDVGDYGLGYCANSLQLGCDCLGNIFYFDATLADSSGKPYTVKKAVCMHEEDSGLLFKHVEYRNGHNESRRGRDLVLSFIATVVNYEYLFYWRLKLDGTIDFEIKLSGELSTNLLSPGEGPMPSHGVLVAPGVNAQYHQHMFAARLDMEVDGAANDIAEVDVVCHPQDPVTNPYGNSFGPVETPLLSETDGARMYDANRGRIWKVSNPAKLNPISGKPVSYKLVPFTKGPAQPPLLTAPGCAVSKKGAFATKHLWVTAYDPAQRYPAGECVPQGDGAGGLPEWTRAGRSLKAADLVLWPTFGVVHIPRPENFPIMNCESTGFSLMPDGFCSGNPAIDMPPDTNAASKCCSPSGAPTH